MSKFDENLFSGTWSLQVHNGKYLGVSSTEHDADGNPLAVAVTTRHDATQIDFRSAGRNTVDQIPVNAYSPALDRYLGPNSARQLVLATSATSFDAVAMTGVSFVLGTGVSDPPPEGDFLTLDPAGIGFEMVSGAPGENAALALSPDLPVGAQIWEFSASGKMIGTPYVYSGAVFLGSSDDLLTAFEMLTGKILWQYGSGESATCSPEVNDVHGLVYVGDSAGALHAVDLNTGEQVWTFSASSSIYARPSAYVEHVFVPSSDGVLYALNSGTGTLTWRYPASGNVQGLFSQPAMADTTVLFGGWDGRLHAVDVTTGQLVWSQDLGNKVNGDPVVDGDTVYVGNDDGQITARSIVDGSETWTHATAGILQSGVTVDDGAVYFGNFAGEAWAVDQASGTVIWSKTFGGKYFSTRPQVADGVVYFLATDGTALALSTADGSTVVSYSLDPTSGGAHLYSGALYAGTDTGKLASLSERFGSYNPVDSIFLLLISHYADLADGQTAHDPSRLPEGVTQLAEFASSADATFAAGCLLSARLPGTDEQVLVLAIGVQAGEYARYLNTGEGSLTDVPASIVGSGVTSVQANDTLIASYLGVQAQVYAALEANLGRSLVIAGLGVGGSLAGIAALDLASAKSTSPPVPPALRIQTFGAPAAGDEAFAALTDRCVATNDRIVNVVDSYADDLLPAALGYRHAGTEITVGSVEIMSNSGCGANVVSCYLGCLMGRMFT